MPAVDALDVEPAVLEYLERATGRRGQAAVDLWLRFTGWRDESDMPLRRKVRRANGAPGGPSKYRPYDARAQISVEARMARARAGAARMAVLAEKLKV